MNESVQVFGPQNLLVTKLVFAYDESGAIGLKDGLPWKIEDELQAFYKEIRQDDILIMAPSTFKSMGYKPLKDRIIIVIADERESTPKQIKSLPDITTFNILGKLEGVFQSNSLVRAYDHLKVVPEDGVSIMFNVAWLGGNQLFQHYKQFADIIVPTLITGVHKADRYLHPELKAYVESQIPVSGKPIREGLGWKTYLIPHL